MSVAIVFVDRVIKLTLAKRGPMCSACVVSRVHATVSQLSTSGQYLAKFIRLHIYENVHIYSVYRHISVKSFSYM